MYEFCLNGNKRIVLSKPRWVTVLSNGTYGSCNEADALGVSINNIVYKIDGKDGIQTENTVTYSIISEDRYQERILESQERIEMALAELSIIIASGGSVNV